MSVWELASLILLLALAVCGLGIIRGSAAQRLAGLEMAGIVTALLTLTMARLLNQPIYIPAALVLAVLSFPAAKIFSQFIEHENDADHR